MRHETAIFVAILATSYREEVSELLIWMRAGGSLLL